jgi:hypothetical protein
LDNFVKILEGGVDGLIEYLSAHVITCLVPALVIGEASAVLCPLMMIQKERVYED